MGRRICKYLIYFRKEYDTLEFGLKNLETFLFQTIDGGLLYDNPNEEILALYVESFHSYYLQLIQSYWMNCFENMNV
jgi:hypothetical protein